MRSGPKPPSVSAFSRANASASSERSTAETSSSGRSKANVIARTPLPVPTSNRRLAHSPAGRELLEHCFDQEFRFGPGNQSSTIGLERAPKEIPVPQEMLQWFTFRPSPYLFTQGLQLLLREGSIKLKIEFNSLLPESVGEKMLDAQPRLFHPFFSKIGCRGLQELENGHRRVVSVSGGEGRSLFSVQTTLPEALARRSRAPLPLGGMARTVCTDTGNCP